MRLLATLLAISFLQAQAASAQQGDLSTLEPNVRTAVEAARLAETEASAAATRAREAAERATQAAERARRGERGFRVLTAEGVRYEGEVRNGLPHGHGVTIGSDFREAGYYTDNQALTVTDNQARDVMRCEFESHGNSGLGICYWRQGQTHAGRFEGGNKNGPGVLRLDNGMRYEGEFASDEPNGLGAYWTAEGELRWAGEWRNGRAVRTESGQTRP